MGIDVDINFDRIKLQCFVCPEPNLIIIIIWAALKWEIKSSAKYSAVIATRRDLRRPELIINNQLPAPALLSHRLNCNSILCWPTVIYPHSYQIYFSIHYWSQELMDPGHWTAPGSFMENIWRTSWVNLVMLSWELRAGVCWRVLSCEGVKRIVGWNVVNVHISIYITQHNTPLIEMQLFVRIKLPWPQHNVHFFNINTTTLAGVNLASRKKQWNGNIMIFGQTDSPAGALHL